MNMKMIGKKLVLAGLLAGAAMASSDLCAWLGFSKMLVPACSFLPKLENLYVAGQALYLHPSKDMFNKQDQQKKAAIQAFMARQKGLTPKLSYPTYKSSCLSVNQWQKHGAIKKVNLVTSSFLKSEKTQQQVAQKNLKKLMAKNKE